MKPDMAGGSGDAGLWASSWAEDEINVPIALSAFRDKNLHHGDRITDLTA